MAKADHIQVQKDTETAKKRNRTDWRTMSSGNHWAQFLTHGTQSKRTAQKPTKFLKEMKHKKVGIKKSWRGRFDKYLKSSWAHNLQREETRLPKTIFSMAKDKLGQGEASQKSDQKEYGNKLRKKFHPES